MNKRPSYEHHTAREFWNGQPTQLETLWTLTKRGKVAHLVLLTHQLGWELRVESGDLLLTSVCRSDGDIEDVSAAWKAAMIEKGGADLSDKKTCPYCNVQMEFPAVGCVRCGRDWLSLKAGFAERDAAQSRGHGPLFWRFVVVILVLWAVYVLWFLTTVGKVMH